MRMNVECGKSESASAAAPAEEVRGNSSSVTIMLMCVETNNVSNKT